MLETQISGKYNVEDLKIFGFKTALEQAGITVDYPVGSTIIFQEKGFGITSYEESTLPFHEVELGFLRRVRHNPIHVVYNIFKDKDGYIGESASIETAYAICRDKPIVLLRPPQFSDSTPDSMQEIILRQIDKISIAQLDTFPSNKLRDFLVKKAEEKVDYGLTETEKETVMNQIIFLLRNQRKHWNG